MGMCLFCLAKKLEHNCINENSLVCLPVALCFTSLPYKELQ